MRIRVLCPDGHPVVLDESRLGSVVACPRCFATFHAEAGGDIASHARAEKGRARPARDDDDDDDDEEDEEDDRLAKKKAKAKPVKKKRDEDEEEEERKPKKKASRRTDDEEEEEEDEDEDDEEPSGPLTKKQRNLQMVQLGLTLIMWSIICIIFLPLISFGQAIMMALAAGANIPWIFYGFVGLAGASVLAIDLLMIIGVSFGFWAPKVAEVKSTIIGVILFGALMLFFILLGTLGVTGVVLEDFDVSKRFGMLCYGLAGVCKFVFFLTTMVYLKKIAGFFKDMLLASEPINLLIEFTVWYVIPQGMRLAIVTWIDLQNLDALSYIVVGLFGLFLLFATIRSYFLLARWVGCVNRIRELVARAIKEM